MKAVTMGINCVCVCSDTQQCLTILLLLLLPPAALSRPQAMSPCHTSCGGICATAATQPRRSRRMQYCCDWQFGCACETVGSS